MASSSQHRCVFVGNIPYDATEEQLIDICREVGPVVSFRLVIDRETGKPKGYGFCEYKDEETALSARRNLQGYEINGRQLRVDFAENDKNTDKNREQGRGGPGLVTTTEPLKQVGGPAVLGESAQHQPIGLHIAITAATAMSGALGGVQTGVHSNQSLHSQSALASDPLTLHLAKMSRFQLNDIVSEMKAMAQQNKEVSRQLLLARPELAKALFQAQLMLGMVNAQVLRMPNIRQTPGPNTLQDTQQAQQPAIQTLPGLPPLAQRNHPGLVPKMHEGQFSSVTQSSLVQKQTSVAPQPMQPRPQIPQLTISHVPQPAMLPAQSGVPPFRPSLPSVRPQPQGVNTSSLNQQLPTSLLQHSGQQVGTANFRHTSQVVLPNMTMQSSGVTRPPLSDATFQPGLRKSGLSDAIANDADRSMQAPVDPAQVYRSNAYLNMQRNKVEDPVEPAVNRPSKMLKLDAGKNMHFSPGSSNVSNATGSQPSQAFASSSTPRNPLVKIEESKHSEKEVSQVPSDVESALLEQVLNLTPEQLNSLPPEQRQQVLQLQLALRRDLRNPS
ncbi:cleavage stimulating factor 64 [Euphorbia peplus]|nr:cleavage stimulating factor 64 [Euphorbia peplus]